mgnify:CR=1 FL=1
MIKNQKSQKGFTIIEVALVLAVGALIFLVVFLAVPALQRNQRNDARKRDASSVSEAVTSYTSNNPGVTLHNHSDDTSYANAQGQGNFIGKYLSQLSNNTESVKFKAFRNSMDASAVASALGDNRDDQMKTIMVIGGATCMTQADSAENAGKGVKKGTNKQAAVIYVNETANGVDAVCTTAN